MQRPIPRRGPFLLLGLLLLLLAPPLRAQEAGLEAQFGGDALAALRREIHDARAAGLPERPLVLRALEGRSKGATDAQVVAAVRGLRRRLQTAAEVLGPESGEELLSSAAAALYVGVDPTALRNARERIRPPALEVALVVLGDLIRRGVPVDRAEEALIALGAAGVDADTFDDYRRLVNADIRTGTSPTLAAQVRLRGMLARTGTPGGRP